MTAPDSSASPDLTRAIADFAFGSQLNPTHGSRPLAWLSPDEMKIDLSDPAQRRFGDYELLEQIGQGGMGVVYRARQHGLERDVAVKLLAAGPWASDEFIARFRREAHNAARMQHPNIVEVHEFGHRDGLNYFSMRLVEGNSLAQRLAASGPMSDTEAAKCVRLLAEAMDYAHRLDVLHLDLKPANVLMGKAGEPLIADFGLARRIDAGGDGGSEEISGTPCYMAPEQAMQQSHPLSASTDIYGLGAILYEVLTGRPPFRGDDAQATLLGVINEPPTRPRALRPQLSLDLEAICLRCLEKQPVDRYASARELADDLQRFLDGHPVSARPLKRMQRLRRWTRREPKLALAVGSALLALGLGLIATGIAWRQAREAQSDAEYLGLRALMPIAHHSSLQALSGIIHQRLSDDARRVLSKTLAASPNPHDWIVAGLIGASLSERGDAELVDESFRRAAQPLPGDRLALIAAIRSCGVFWRWSGAGRRGAWAYNCPVPDAPLRLAKADPQNLFARTMLLSWSGGNRESLSSGLVRTDHLLWQVGHDPVARARMRKLMAYAANATTWDDGSRAMLDAKVKAYGVDYFPMPNARTIYDGLYSEESASVEKTRAGLSNRWNQAWNFNPRGLWLLAKLCNPQHPQFDASMRADCTRIMHMLADSKGEVEVNVVGWRGLARLAKGMPMGAEMADRMRQYTWLLEQGLWSRERNPVRSSHLYTRDFVAHGQWEAMLRHADRLKVPRQPPAGWQSSYPMVPWLAH